MASIRKIQAPGIQKNEIDRSQYDSKNKVDYSLPNSPTVLVTGFASKGEDLTIQWMNSKATLDDSYGNPTTEFEKYFYNGISEVLNRGGTCLAARLPYSNDAYRKYNYIEYEATFTPLATDSVFELNTLKTYQKSLSTLIDYLNANDMPVDVPYGIDTIYGLYHTIYDIYTQYFSSNNTPNQPEGSITIEDMYRTLSTCIENVKERDNPLESLYINDTNITSYLDISLKTTDDLSTVGGKNSIEQFDHYLVNERSVIPNTIRIYDVLRSEYDVFDNSTTYVSSENGVTNDFLGIVPVIVTPVNALFFQGMLNFTPSFIIDSKYDLAFNQLSTFTSLTNSNVSVDYYPSVGNSVDSCMTIPLASQQSQETIELSVDCHNQESLSKIASEQFPYIGYSNDQHFAIDNLKNIGIVVFKAYKDSDNGNKISYQLLESFVGSLDYDAYDPITKSNIYIDNIVNSQSQFIRVVSNVNRADIIKSSTIAMSRQPAVSMGFYNIDCKKTISYKTSIVEGLTYVLNAAANYHNYPIDLIIDAGITNIAQLTRTTNDMTIDTSKHPRIAEYTRFTLNSAADTVGWKAIMKKFDDFVKYTRKDCMFIADGLRPFCLDGNYKIVRKTAPGNTVSKSILPKLKFISNAIDSSYSAGYCNWFYQQDASSTEFIWLPPSIKAAGVYIYCDTYFYPWSAPAGMTRGRLDDVVDVAFIPLEDEAGIIYTSKWNYAMSYPIDGIVIEGHKTFQTDKTALDRVNIRRLLLNLEKKVARSARQFIYEHNTPYLRTRFVDAIRPFFEDAVQRDGVKEYAIKCDDEINTPEVIDNNELRCRIAVKPVKCVDYILIDFICTRQGANVNEEVFR